MSAPAVPLLLVVEERNELRDELADYVRSLGFIAMPVGDTDSATVVVRALRPDLILWHGADAEAPGRAAVSEWRSRRPDTPIVAVLRAPGGPDDELRRSGVDAVLHPPVVRGHIERVVLQLLGLPDRRASRETDSPLM